MRVGVLKKLTFVICICTVSACAVYDPFPSHLLIDGKKTAIDDVIEHPRKYDGKPIAGEFYFSCKDTYFAFLDRQSYDEMQRGELELAYRFRFLKELEQLCEGEQPKYFEGVIINTCEYTFGNCPDWYRTYLVKESGDGELANTAGTESYPLRIPDVLSHRADYYGKKVYVSGFLSTQSENLHLFENSTQYERNDYTRCLNKTFVPEQQNLFEERDKYHKERVVVFGKLGPVDNTFFDTGGCGEIGISVEEIY